MSGKISASSHGNRGERFWSNRSFMLARSPICAHDPLRTPDRREYLRAPDLGIQLRSLGRHSACQIFQHVSHGHSQAANAWFATAFVWFDCDDLCVIHNELLRGDMITNKAIRLHFHAIQYEAPAVASHSNTASTIRTNAVSCQRLRKCRASGSGRPSS
jgi:hypothetical protein